MLLRSMRNYYPFPEPHTSLLQRAVLIVAQLKDYTTINLVDEALPDDDQAYASIVRVSPEGEEWDVLRKTPYEAAETFFHHYLDASRVGGEEPVVTYCSFD